jgi:hypothetical protein
MYQSTVDQQHMGILKSCLVSIAVLLLLQSCQMMRQSSKHGFNEGYYKSRLLRKKVKTLYVVPDADSIRVYSRKKLSKGAVDTAEALKLAFPANEKPTTFENYLFRQNTFDADLQSILFKYRPARHPYPHQINTSFNGVIYLGYRTDMYHLRYRQTPLQVFGARSDTTGSAWARLPALALRLYKEPTLKRAIRFTTTALSIFQELPQLSPSKKSPCA